MFVFVYSFFRPFEQKIEQRAEDRNRRLLSLSYKQELAANFRSWNFELDLKRAGAIRARTRSWN